MECSRCHNQNVERLYELNGRYYCRECIQFHRVWIDETCQQENHQYPACQVQYHLDFELSPTQRKYPDSLLKIIKVINIPPSWQSAVLEKQKSYLS